MRRIALVPALVHEKRRTKDRMPLQITLMSVQVNFSYVDYFVSDSIFNQEIIIKSVPIIVFKAIAFSQIGIRRTGSVRHRLKNVSRWVSFFTSVT